MRFLLKRRTPACLSRTFISSLRIGSKELRTSFFPFCCEVAEEKKSLAAYGAAAKGNTFLNYAGIKADLLPFVVDRSPGKIGKFLPGSRIPVLDEGELIRRKA